MDQTMGRYQGAMWADSWQHDTPGLSWPPSPAHLLHPRQNAGACRVHTLQSPPGAKHAWYAQDNGPTHSGSLSVSLARVMARCAGDPLAVPGLRGGAGAARGRGGPGGICWRRGGWSAAASVPSTHAPPRSRCACPCSFVDVCGGWARQAGCCWERQRHPCCVAGSCPHPLRRRHRHAPLLTRRQSGSLVSPSRRRA